MSDPPVRARPSGIKKSKLKVESVLSGKVGALDEEEEELLAPDAVCRHTTAARSWATERDMNFIAAERG